MVGLSSKGVLAKVMEFPWKWIYHKMVLLGKMLKVEIYMLR